MEPWSFSNTSSNPLPCNHSKTVWLTNSWVTGASPEHSAVTIHFPCLQNEDRSDVSLKIIVQLRMIAKCFETIKKLYKCQLWLQPFKTMGCMIYKWKRWAMAGNTSSLVLISIPAHHQVVIRRQTQQRGRRREGWTTSWLRFPWPLPSHCHQEGRATISDKRGQWQELPDGRMTPRSLLKWRQHEERRRGAPPKQMTKEGP